MTPIIALHLAAAILALIIGPTVLWLAKGTARHKLLGRIWALAMLVTALSSFGIRVVNHGQFSWIHLLSVLTLVGLARAILAIRRGDIGGHKAAMRGLFIGLALAGVAAVATPQRFLHEMVVGWMT